MTTTAPPPMSWSDTMSIMSELRDLYSNSDSNDAQDITNLNNTINDLSSNAGTKGMRLNNDLESLRVKVLDMEEKCEKQNKVSVN